MKNDTMKADTQMRKVQLTINNPAVHGFDHARIKKELAQMKSCIYYIMGDEIGGKESTHHTHIYAVYKAPVRFSTIKNRFPCAHIEKALGTHADNINYVKKEGKWKHHEKGTTSVADTLEVWGECPPDAQGDDVKKMLLYMYIKEGLSNFEILEKCSDYIFDTDKIDRVRLTIKQEEYRGNWRDLDVTYIFGKTGAGKSRYVMEKYGYENVFRVTDSLHPWDTYLGQDVVVFEEFSSTFQIQKMLNYLDGYPLKLEARYSDKVACFTKVYVISNMNLEQQYPNVRDENREVWNAFIRRIKKVIWYKSSTEIIHYDNTDDYFHRDNLTGQPPQHLDF